MGHLVSGSDRTESISHVPPGRSQSQQTIFRRLGDLGAEVILAGGSLSTHLTTGKLLRARLVVLAAAAGGAHRSERAQNAAVAVELVHAGALCHDDVVDCSATRRGILTIAHQYGPRAAVLAGSALMVRAAELLAAEPPAVRRAVGRALRDVARGQTDEALDVFDAEQSPDAYRRRAYAKTGALYELAARLGARAGDLPTLAVEALGAYGAEIGVAFQLADDVRDLLGGPELGREAGTDLRQGVYTLPVLMTLAGRCAGGDRLRSLLSDAGSPEGLGSAVQLLRTNGALQATAAETAARVVRAREALRLLPASRARARLERFAQRFLPPSLRADVAGLRFDPPIDDPASDLPRAYVRPPVADLVARVETAPAAMRVPLGRFWAHVGTPADAAPWVEDAAVATGLGALLLTLGTEIEASAIRSRGTWVAAVTAVGVIDLLVADMFALLAGLPAPVARALASRVSAALRKAAARAAEVDGAEPIAPADVAALTDAIGRATADVIALGAVR